MVDCGGRTANRPKTNLRERRLVFWGLLCAVVILPMTARSAALEMTLAPTAVPSAVASWPWSEGRIDFVQQCQQRVGPFVTQGTAYQRLHHAQSQGYGVSGVFPCYGGGGRGYCFNVFYPC